MVDGLGCLPESMSSQNEPTREILRMIDVRFVYFVYLAHQGGMRYQRYHRQGAKGMVVGTRVAVWQFISSMVPG